MALENNSNLEHIDSQQGAQEQLALQKFDEIFNRLHGNTSLNEEKFWENALEIEKDWGVKWWIMSYYNPNSWYQEISISWDWEGNNHSTYGLIKQNWKFRLETSVWENHDKKVIDNITPEELINKILPNFEKRINEGEIMRAQSRQKALEDANQYAYQQDQQDADRLLQENWLA